jgi:hypothetical protein
MIKIEFKKINHSYPLLFKLHELSYDIPNSFLSVADW